MQYVQVQAGENRTTVLGFALTRSLKNLKLVRIEWQHEHSQWICYEATDQLPAVTGHDRVI